MNNNPPPGWGQFIYGPPQQYSGGTQQYAAGAQQYATGAYIPQQYIVPMSQPTQMPPNMYGGMPMAYLQPTPPPSGPPPNKRRRIESVTTGIEEFLPPQSGLSGVSTQPQMETFQMQMTEPQLPQTPQSQGYAPPQAQPWVQSQSQFQVQTQFQPQRQVQQPPKIQPQHQAQQPLHVQPQIQVQRPPQAQRKPQVRRPPQVQRQPQVEEPQVQQTPQAQQSRQIQQSSQTQSQPQVQLSSQTYTQPQGYPVFILKRNQPPLPQPTPPTETPESHQDDLDGQLRDIADSNFEALQDESEQEEQVPPARETSPAPQTPQVRQIPQSSQLPSQIRVQESSEARRLLEKKLYPGDHLRAKDYDEQFVSDVELDSPLGESDIDELVISDVSAHENYFPDPNDHYEFYLEIERILNTWGASHGLGMNYVESEVDGQFTVSVSCDAYGCEWSAEIRTVAPSKFHLVVLQGTHNHQEPQTSKTFHVMSEHQKDLLTTCFLEHKGKSLTREDVVGVLESNKKEGEYTQFSCRQLNEFRHSFRSRMANVYDARTVLRVMRAKGYIVKEAVEKGQFVCGVFAHPWCLQMWKRFPDFISFGMDTPIDLSRNVVTEGMVQTNGSPVCHAFGIIAAGEKDNTCDQALRLVEQIRQENGIAVPKCVMTCDDGALHRAVRKVWKNTYTQICASMMDWLLESNLDRLWIGCGYIPPRQPTNNRGYPKDTRSFLRELNGHSLPVSVVDCIPEAGWIPDNGDATLKKIQTDSVRLPEVECAAVKMNLPKPKRHDDYFTHAVQREKYASDHVFKDFIRLRQAPDKETFDFRWAQFQVRWHSRTNILKYLADTYMSNVDLWAEHCTRHYRNYGQLRTGETPLPYAFERIGEEPKTVINIVQNVEAAVSRMRKNHELVLPDVKQQSQKTSAANEWSKNIKGHYDKNIVSFLGVQWRGAKKAEKVKYNLLAPDCHPRCCRIIWDQYGIPCMHMFAKMIADGQLPLVPANISRRWLLDDD